jgi:uncharacterized protein
MVDLNIRNEIHRIVKYVKSTSVCPDGSKFHEVLASLRDVTGIESLKGLAFRYDEFAIRVGSSQSMEAIAASLAQVAAFALSIAPSVVEIVPLDAFDSVLVTRYAACAGERLAGIETTAAPFREAASERFRADMQKLVDHGLVHPYARGEFHWLISSETGTLVLDSWEALRECSAAEGRELMGNVDRILASRRQASPSAKPAASVQAAASRTTTTRSRIEEVFGCPRVLLPVIHPVDEATAMASVRVARGAGVRGIFLINQGMSAEQVLELVMVVRARYPELWVGVNLLGVPPARVLDWGLEVCGNRLDGIWADNAAIEEDSVVQPMAQSLVAARRGHGWSGLYFGGVAFKYQREVQAANLGRAAAAALPYMDVICTSGPGTGQAAEAQKVIAMRSGVGDAVALALASGVSEANVADYLPYVDAYLVGTSLEHAFGVLDPARVARLHRTIMAYR